MAAAATGSGSAPPRACLMVAIWSMFTPSFAILFHPYALFYGVGNLFCPCCNLIFILPLHHYPQKRFGPRIADKYPAILIELVFNTLDQCSSLRKLHDIPLFRNPYIQ